MLALTGATGALGGLVATALGPEVDRLVVRDASRAPRQGAEVVEATYGDREACLRAFDGVDVLLLVSAAESATRREEHRTAIEAAAGAGVRHVVYTSFAGASPDALFTLGRDHHDAEQAIRASGMEFTFLRDNFYADVLPLFATDGVIAGPAGGGRVAAVARADVADVATVVLRSPADHVGATYELTGPEALTLTEAAQRLTEALGRPFSFRDESLTEAYESRRRWSSEQWQLDAWVSTYTAIRDGEVARVSDDVERVGGHPARTLEQAVRP
ncbi:SDR family oxidoreductase [Nocardioides mangrovicus]|uniref:SDR family oxidoreductase n=1 Tax=Nocardioides mangrovicus TaxID=2478913 RepID=A0A3L8P3V4_9ACTN|nr:SDR family oxidoreductase [Nocardioides mangrovicus]RLV50070.1 SDR family oxidoreductase [Nocardioides mangrovicus]